MGNCKLKPEATGTTVEHPAKTVRATYASGIGIDVHLDLLVCTYERLEENGDVVTQSHTFGTKQSDLTAFATWCRDLKPEIILMESTGVYWRSPYEALERVGFTSEQLVLVNARDVRAALGRKTDVKDSQRLCEFARFGSFKRSFIPAMAFRDMRLLERAYQKSKADLARAKQRYQKQLAALGCRATSVFSDIRGKAATEILEAKIFQKPDLADIVERAARRYHLRSSPEDILDALNFKGCELVYEQLRDDHSMLWQLEEHANKTLRRLAKLQEPYQNQIELLKGIPGINEVSARLVFAELCPNLKEHFCDSEHFASWMGICPGDNKSAGIQKSGKTPKGNKWIRRVLTECANAVAKKKSGYAVKKFMAFKLKRGWKRAIVAVAHYLCRVIYSVLCNAKSFEERYSEPLREAVVGRAKTAFRLLKKECKNLSLSENGDFYDASTGEVLLTVPIICQAGRTSSG